MKTCTVCGVEFEFGTDICGGCKAEIDRLTSRLTAAIYNHISIGGRLKFTEEQMSVLSRRIAEYLDRWIPSPKIEVDVVPTGDPEDRTFKLRYTIPLMPAKK